MSDQRSPTKEQLGRAIRIVQGELLWKPDSAERHLRRRIKREHLPNIASLADYEDVIRKIVHQVEAKVYIYWYNETTPYISVVDVINDSTWLVMFSMEGILESAYLVERPHYYLSEPEFELICKLGDIV